jgi:hypothetical protein
MDEPEFYEGVRCMLVDKGATPSWMYKHVLDIEDSVIDSYFENEGVELKL